MMDTLLSKVTDKVLGRDDDDDDKNDKNDRGTGYGGHGGRSQNAHHDRDTRNRNYIPSAEAYSTGHTEHRPAQGSNAAQSYYSGNYDGAVDEAAKHAPAHEDKCFFSTALGLVAGREHQLAHEDVDENEYVGAHQMLYGQQQHHQEGKKADSRSVGVAAVMQALKKVTGSGSGGAGQNAFVGMAMAECVKLFDAKSSQGALTSGANKQDAVSAAAQMAMKLMIKSKMQSAMGGSGGSGSGMGGGLMGTAMGVFAGQGSHGSGSSGHGNGGGGGGGLLGMASHLLK